MSTRPARHLGRRAVAACCLLLLCGAAGARAQAQATAPAPPRTRAECEAAHPVSLGREGKDVVWVPTSDAVALAMLSIAQVTPADVVLDLGAGDGKITIAAAKSPFGARAVGIEYDAELAKLAACLAQAEGVSDRVRVVEGDIFKEDFGAATVVTMYLLPQLNRCVRHRLLAMAPGTRVVAHTFAMAEWQADQSVQIQGREVRLWIVPARVDGVWDMSDSQGAAFALDLRQAFQAVSGEITRGGSRQALATATLRGVELRFGYDVDGVPTRFSGTVRASEITGVLTTGHAARTATGRLRGTLRDAPWAAMAPDCGRYYER
jgi:precorrin-6B methylase 2